MKKCALIEVTEDGQVSVGFREKDDTEGIEGMDMGDEGYDMQPADNLNAALSMAREMLTGDPKAEAENAQAFERGYGKMMGGA